MNLGHSIRVVSTMWGNVTEPITQTHRLIIETFIDGDGDSEDAEVLFSDDSDEDSQDESYKSPKKKTKPVWTPMSADTMLLKVCVSGVWIRGSGVTYYDFTNKSGVVNWWYNHICTKIIHTIDFYMILHTHILRKYIFVWFLIKYIVTHLSKT